MLRNMDIKLFAKHLKVCKTLKSLQSTQLHFWNATDFLFFAELTQLRLCYFAFLRFCDRKIFEDTITDIHSTEADQTMVLMAIL